MTIQSSASPNVPKASSLAMTASGTFRTSQPWCVISAVEVRADEGAWRFDFSF